MDLRSVKVRLTAPNPLDEAQDIELTLFCSFAIALSFSILTHSAPSPSTSGRLSLMSRTLANELSELTHETYANNGHASMDEASISRALRSNRQTSAKGRPGYPRNTLQPTLQFLQPDLLQKSEPPSGNLRLNLGGLAASMDLGEFEALPQTTINPQP